MTTAPAPMSPSPATIIQAVGFVAHGPQEGMTHAWWHDPATDRWYLEHPTQHLRPSRVTPGSVVLEWALVRGHIATGNPDDDDAASVPTGTIVYCVALGPMTLAEATAWRRDRTREAWDREVAHRPAPPTVYRNRDQEPMTAADVIRRAAEVDLEPAVVDGTLWWVSRFGANVRPQATDTALVLLLDRFAPLVAAKVCKVDPPGCARCKRPAVAVEAIGGRLLCDRHVTEPILAAVAPPPGWLDTQAAMPAAIIPEDPAETRRRIAMSNLEAQRMPMPRDAERAVTKRERRGGRGW